jgi:ribose 1,5-bisphosphokinase
MANLFYVMGASGVGKDSLLKYAREYIAHDTSLVFAHRYITRPSDAGGENHVALSHREFRERERQDCFSMSWQSHGNSYGIGVEINHWLEQGLSVVVNGSRSYFPSAIKRYKKIIPILVCADKLRLAERLINRGREDAQQVQNRLNLSAHVNYKLDHPSLVRIENNGDLSEAGDTLVDILTKVALKNKESVT